VTKADTEAMGFIDEINSFDPQMFVRVDLARYAPGGTTTLWFDGATSTVREFDKQEVAAAVSQQPKDGISVPEAQPIPA
jgi:hypothetical protein